MTDRAGRVPSERVAPATTVAHELLVGTENAKHFGTQWRVLYGEAGASKRSSVYAGYSSNYFHLATSNPSLFRHGPRKCSSGTVPRERASGPAARPAVDRWAFLEDNRGIRAEGNAQIVQILQPTCDLRPR